MPEDSGSQTPGSVEPPGGHRVKKVLGGIVNALELGVGRPEAPKVHASDIGTRLAEERTELAAERTYIAAERTLMAWIRTSLSMISFGFTISKLGQVLHEVNTKGVLGRTRTFSVASIAYFLVILGTVALLGACWQHRNRVRELYAMGVRHQLSITFYVAVVLALVGGFALSSMVASL